jgi:hypothetical protein
MAQEPQKNNIVLIVIAIIGVAGTIIATAIGVVGNYNIEKFRQEAELTRMALVSIATQGGATQASMAGTISAPADTPYPTNEPPPTYTPYPTYTPQKIPTTTSKPQPTMLLPFQDTFDLRLGQEWQPILGTWRVVNGHLTTDDNNDWRRIFVGDTAWQNYAVEVDVWSEDWLYPVQIIVRAQQGTYVAMQTTINTTDFILYGGGDPLVIAHSDIGVTAQSGARYEATYHLRVEAVGDIFTAYINGNMVLQVQDATLPNGRTGLAFRTYYSDWFDNFQVTALP